jgi:hypothetical protein
MSTPSGKPFDPLDLSPYAPKRARERSTLDRPSVENDDKIEKSDDEAAIALPYASRSAMRPEGADERPVDPGAADQAQSPSGPGTTAGLVGEKPAPDQAAGDVDLARLESSLQWLQREGSVGHLPRAVQLPPVSGLRPVGPESARARGEQFINGVRVPPSLAPERLRPPPPMRQRRDNLRGPLRVLLASVIAAPIAYYFSVGNQAPNLASMSEPAHESGLAAFASRLVASSEFPVAKDRLRPGDAEAYNTVVSTRNKLVAQPTASTQPTTSAQPAASTQPAVSTQPATSTQSATSARAETQAELPPSPAPDHAAPVSQTVRELDPGSIKLLMQQGEQFVASGDLVAARLVYRRAAESGNAAAALALGATFDPVVLAKIGVKGMGADVEKARSWYEKAKEFGSPDAPRRLEMLANR